MYALVPNNGQVQNYGLVAKKLVFKLKKTYQDDKSLLVNQRIKNWNPIIIYLKEWYSLIPILLDDNNT